MTASTVVQLLAEEHDLVLTLEGRAAVGEVGAYFGRRDDGSRIVLKWFEQPEWAESLQQAIQGVERLRAKGYPAPKHEPLLVIPGGLVVVQSAVERGGVLDRMTHRLLDDLLVLNELQAGEGHPGDDWSATTVELLTRGGDGWCLHEPLRRHSARAASILDQIERIGANIVGRPLPQTDIVHVDFHHRNILQDRDQVVAVIDWEGSMIGDRIFDLVTVGFCAGVAECDPGVEERIWDCVKRDGDKEAVAAYVGLMALRRLDWTIRHHPDEVDYWAQVSSRYLAAFA